MKRTALSQGGPLLTAQTVLTNLQVAGLGKFSEAEWMDLISLRAVLPSTISKILQACQFNAVAGRVRVHTSDFGMAAKLDPRAPWVKAAMLLSQYMGHVDLDSEEIVNTTFGGRREVIAKKLSPSALSI